MFRWERLRGEHSGVMCVCVSPACLRVDKMSTGGHFKHVIITFYHAKASSVKCVFTNVHRWGHGGSTAATHRPVSSHCIQLVYFASSGRCSAAKWKVMRKSTCWARSLAFSHIITEIDLSFLPLHSQPLSIERYYIWNSCIFSFEMYTVLLMQPRN